jgi:hypothetical protein
LERLSFVEISLLILESFNFLSRVVLVDREEGKFLSVFISQPLVNEFKWQHPIFDFLVF